MEDESHRARYVPSLSGDVTSLHSHDESTQSRRSMSAHGDRTLQRWLPFRSYFRSRREEQHRSSLSLQPVTVYHTSHSPNPPLARSHSSLPNVSGACQQETSLWDQAYDNLRASEDKKVKKLMNEYEALLREDLLPDDKDLSGSHPQASTKPGSSDAINAQSSSLFDRASRHAQLEEELKRGKAKHEIKGKVIIRGHVIDIQSYIVNIATGLDFAKYWIGQAVGAPPGASVAWAVTCLGLPLFKKGAQVDKANKEGLAYVSSRMQVYIALEQLLLPTDGPSRSEAARDQIRSSLVDLYERILDFQVRSIVRFRRYRFYENEFGKDNWQRMKSAIQDLESAIWKDSLLVATTDSNKYLQELLQNAHEIQQEMMAVNHQQLEVLQAMGTNSSEQTDIQSQMLQKEEERYQDTRQRQCMEALRLDPRYEDSKELIDARVEGTCCWFLDQADYKNWLLNAGGCLLVTADPGCGKSVLTKYVLEHEDLHKDKDISGITCYFFFRAQDQNTFTMALSALLHQLLGKVKGMFEHILPLHNSEGHKMIRNEMALSKVLMEILSDSRTPSVTFFLDALDECKDNHREKLLAWIARIGILENIAARHRFFLTGRPYDSVLQHFRQMRSSLIVHIPGNDSSIEISKEIDIVIRDRCQKLFESKRICEDTRQSLEIKLLAQSNSTYLFVRLVFDLLKRQCHGNLTANELEEVLQDLPDSLDEVYDRILSRNTIDGGRSKKTVSLILRVMLSARRPLTIQEIQCIVKMQSQSSPLHHEALNLEPVQTFSDKLRNWCGLFVRVSNEGQVSFIHQTAREFLLRKTENNVLNIVAPRVWAHSISHTEAHALLAEVCMAYLSLKDFGQSIDLHSLDDGSDNTMHTHSTQKENKSEQSRRYPFLNYAARHWNHHFIEGHCDNSPVAANKALGLYNDKTNYFLNWALRADISSLAMLYWFLNLDWIPESLMVAASISPPIFKRLMGRFDSPSNFPRAELALIVAIDKEHEESAKLLIEGGVNPNCKSPNGRTALSECVLNSLKSTTTCLLSKGADIDADAICIASSQEDTHFLEVFLKHNIDVNATNAVGNTPLHFAAQSGREKAVELLLNHKADIGIRSRLCGQTALSHAALGGSLEVMRLLLNRDINHDIDINEENKFWSTPLVIAALMGHHKIVEILLEHHADFELCNMTGKSPLHYAALGGYTEIVKILLNHKASVDGQDRHGCTALSSSAQAGHLSCVEMLLQHGADPHILDADGDTAILCAAMNGHHETVSLLLKHEAIVAPENSTGNTAMHLAAKGNIYEKDIVYNEDDGSGAEIAKIDTDIKNCIKTMQILLDAGANINATNWEGLTPLMRAVSRLRSHGPILKWMLEQGATINVRDRKGCTPMHYVYSDEALRILLENGLDINEQNYSGQTPLQHILAEDVGIKSFSRVKNLYSAMVSHGADLTIEDSDGFSPPKQLEGGMSFSSQAIWLDYQANLTATCDTIYSTVQSTINLNSCLKIENGQLKWARNGNFSAYAKKTWLCNGGKILQSLVLDSDGAEKKTYIWLDERIANNDGDLEFLDLD